MESGGDESRKGKGGANRSEAIARPASAHFAPQASAPTPLAAADGGVAPAERVAGETPQGTPICLVSGNAGDHKLIHELLRAANQAPSYEDFVSWLDEPTYEPSNRLLIKIGSQIVSHVHLLDRIGWFGGVKLPVGGIQDLATLPEYRDAGYDRLLLAAAEQALRDDQAVVAIARTDRPEVFQASGWSEVRRQCHTEANISDILARLPSTGSSRGRRARSQGIRLWRQVELDAVRSVYRSTAEATEWGAWERTEPYWRWLVGRKAHDELIVAVHGPDQWEELDRPANIIGYAVKRGSQLVEMCVLPKFAGTARQLLARACQDAIEQNHRTLSLHTPVSDPLHELMLKAGGNWSGNGRLGGVTLMIKLLDPARWIESLFPVLLGRAKLAGVKRPCHFVFDTGRRKYRCDLTRRSSRLERDDQATADVCCRPESLAALLVGNLEVAAAQEADQLEIGNETTAERLAALFPPESFWQSRFDLLRF